MDWMTKKKTSSMGTFWMVKVTAHCGQSIAVDVGVEWIGGGGRGGRL